MKTHNYSVYLLTNKYNRVIYTGVTNDLERRVWEHKNEKSNSFTSRYLCNKLVYYEDYQYVTDAIAREKQIKSGPRKQKIELINSVNPNWEDLSVGWFGEE